MSAREQSLILSHPLMYKAARNLRFPNFSSSSTALFLLGFRV